MKKIILLLCVMIGSVCLAGSIQSDVQESSTSICSITVENEVGDRLEGVLIQVKSSAVRGTTDGSGEVRLDCDESATLVISSSDLSPYEFARDNRSKITVTIDSSSGEITVHGN